MPGFIPQTRFGSRPKFLHNALTGGLAGCVIASCLPSALHAEPSLSELAAEIRALKASNDQMRVENRQMKAAISEMRGETRRTRDKVRAAVAREPAITPMPPAAAALPPGAVPAFVTADKKFQFGAITITPGGFLAGESVFRTRPVNSDVATSFQSIPFSNSPLAHTNEFRPSARQSRLALLVEGAITPTFIAGGYAELDFLAAANTANSNQTDSYQPRIRNLYMTLDNEDYGMHVLAGQNWTLLTLNSKGITPRNEVTPTVIDSNQNVGSIYARQPQIRLTKDFGKKLWLSVSAEQPETTFASPTCATAGFTSAGSAGTLTPTGGNGGVTPFAPAAINSITCGVVGAGSNTTATNYSLNHIPDVIGKAVYEARVFDRDVHFEAFGIVTNLYDRVSATDGTNQYFYNRDTRGWGAGGGVIAPVIPRRLDVQLNAMYGRGIGRYGPLQIGEASFNPDGSVKALPELIALTGVTLHATPAIDIYGYAGVESATRSYYSNPLTATGAISYVGVGSPAIDNSGCKTEGSAVCTGTTKLGYELTAGFWDKIYKGSFGEIRGGVQYSYVQRQLFNAPSTFGVASFHTTKTDENMVFTSLRYYPFQ